ncbi:MaoC/PaaZ C-terminal domain-containing protein [Janthinobacterium sp. HLX7-2]|uniref:MaoC/PaaZ C-terminal domain-containing protein n=1 Tax=Janthinobacterium sp. HLX7-2 TaxID=1259331 RepID=UPI003F26950A
MAFDYHRLMHWHFPDVRHTYTEKDTMLYALSLGYCSDPLDTAELQFVYEKDLQAVPSMAVILGSPGAWMQHPDTGLDWLQVLHGEQYLTLHQPLPAAAAIIGRTRVTGITDKGAGKGALLACETRVSEQASGKLLATVEQVYFCRGHGGYSARGQPSDESVSKLPVMPSAPADIVCDLPTRLDMALLYRLSGDLNPLHAEPQLARSAGFPRPILHGLATFGVIGHALLKTCCHHEAARLQVLNARFSAPVFPGETIRTEIWRRGMHVFFRAHVVERNALVIDKGYALITP